jgi:hypothetical protein
MMTARRRVGLLAAVGLVGAACSPAPPPVQPAPILAPIEPPAARDSEPASAPVAATDAGPAPARAPLPSPTEAALKEWSRKSQCQDFDYYPNGGIQSFWCHRPARVTIASIRALAGVDIFTKGPHTADTLALDAASDFGHYNPEFVTWLVEHAGPSTRGSAAQKATQASYDAHLKPLAEIFWKTYAKAQADQACFTREKTAYADLIAKKKLPKDYYERWFYFMNPYFCDKGPQKTFNFYSDNGFDAGVDGNVAKTVIGFWLRRSMDGTMDEFAEGLKSLLAAYQPELTAAPAKLADPVALTRVLDAGVRAAAACKDPAAKKPSSSVTITVSGDGTVSARLMAPRGQASSAQQTCIESKIAAPQMTPPFDGPALIFNRTIALK